MKLYFDKRLKDPTYYGQQGFRNGKKVTSKNIIKFGKHSELLKITDDPEAYVARRYESGMKNTGPEKWNILCPLISINVFLIQTTLLLPLPG